MNGTHAHRGSKCRLWSKKHIGIDEKTLELLAVEVTSSSIGDAPMFPDLFDQIPPDQEIASVTAPSRQIAAQSACRAMDWANDTRKCQHAIATRKAHAVIPPRKYAKLCKPDSSGAKARNEAVRASKYLGRALLKKVTGYHRRSRVEAK